MEVDALVERILLDIKGVFKRDPNVDEFDILPVLDAQNKSPVIHVGHKMALEAWCIKHVYSYAYNKLMDWREKKHKTDPANILSWSSAVLLLNPDVLTVWNMRKEMILAGKLNPEEDKKFSHLVITRKPKSSEVFAHRKWLLMQQLSKTKSSDTDYSSFNSLSPELVDHEMEICTLAADRYPNNYHAWSHRIWVIQKTLMHYPEVLIKELTWSEQWAACHVSDHSGLQYRQFLLDTLFNQALHNSSQKMLLDLHTSNEIEQRHCFSDHETEDYKITSSVTTHEKNGDCVTDMSPCQNQTGRENTFITTVLYLLRKELSLVSELMQLYPCHESLWYHRRYVLHSLKENGLIISPNSLANANTAIIKVLNLGPSCKKSKLESNSVPNNCYYYFSLEKELSFIEECCNQINGNSLQLSLATKYKQWLMSELGLELVNR